MNNPPYYQHHVFFCLNERSNEQSCSHFQAQQAFDHCKAGVKKQGLSGPAGVRVNKAGCLDRCAGGPVVVVYPQGVWYTFVDNDDIDEIIESHLKNNVPVERLMIAPDVGR